MKRNYRQCSTCRGRGQLMRFAHATVRCTRCAGHGHILRKGYSWMRCHGEAHSNAHIDHCMVCAPRWGWVAVPRGTEMRLWEQRVLGGSLIHAGLSSWDTNLVLSDRETRLAIGHLPDGLRVADECAFSYWAGQTTLACLHVFL